jgi:predicted transcriptional regulator
MDQPAPSALDLTTLGLTARIVSAYVSANPLEGADLPGLIRVVRAALDDVARGWPAAKEAITPSSTQIRRSIRPEAIVSFLDGKPYKTLRRHLHGHGLTEADYRARFGLPDDYPLTAAEYRDRRSAMAKASGLGRR